VLVLCQGTVVYKRGEFERPGWDRVMAVNLDSLMHCCRKLQAGSCCPRQDARAARSSSSARFRRAGRLQRRQPGLCRVQGRRDEPGASTLGVAWAPEGIRVNGMAPGLVDTKLTKVTTQHPKRLEGALASHPACTGMGTPADMAGAVLFLASPLAAYVAGQTLNCRRRTVAGPLNRRPALPTERHRDEFRTHSDKVKDAAGPARRLHGPAHLPQRAGPSTTGSTTPPTCGSTGRGWTR
jgi:hypothetical protein